MYPACIVACSAAWIRRIISQAVIRNAHVINVYHGHNESGACILMAVGTVRARTLPYIQ